MRPSDATTLYLYRGILITWYRIEEACGRTRYQTAWECGDQWHQSRARRTIDCAVHDAETQINHQLADRSAERSA